MAIKDKEEVTSDWFSRTIFINVSEANSYQNDPSLSPNDRLTEALWPAILDFSKEGSDFEERGKDDLRAAQRRILIDLPPTPIGEALEGIFRQDKASRRRLKKINDCYTILLQTTLMIVLSELAKETYEDSPPSDLTAIINAYCFELSDRNVFNTLKTTLNTFASSKIPFYVTELSDLTEVLNSPVLQKAQSFFENQKSETSTESEQIEEDCLQAEEHFIAIFQAFAFLYKYKWRSIRKIQRQPRSAAEAEAPYQPSTVEAEQEYAEQYEIEYIPLHQASASIEVQTEILEDFLPANSVVLLDPARASSNDFLSLFPFVVDYNTSVVPNKGQQSNADLYLFSQKSKEGYIFKHATLTRNMLFKRDVEEQSEIPIALRHFELWLRS